MKPLYAIFILFLFVAKSSDGQSYKESKPLQEHLAIVNEHWYDVDLETEMVSFSSDDDRIQTHLLEVYRYLDNHTPTQLNDKQIQNRKAHLAVLNEYALSGEFPRNTGHLERTPYFVDQYDTPCAVANLLIEDEQAELTNQLRLENNFSFLKDMPRKPIEKWASANGFEFWELEWIQPGYPYYPETRFIPSEERFNGTVNQIEFNANEGLTCYAGAFDSLGLRSFYCKDINDDELSFAVQPNGESFDFEFLGQNQFAIAGAYATNVDSVGLGIISESELNFIPLANVLSYSSHAVEKIGNEIFFDAYFKALGVSHIYMMDANGLNVSYILEVEGIINDIVGYDNGVAIAGEFSEVVYNNDTISCSNFALIKDSIVSDLNCTMASETNRLRIIDDKLYLLGKCASNPDNDSECSFTFDSQEGWKSLLDSASVAGMNAVQGEVSLYDVIDYHDTILISGECELPWDGLMYSYPSRSLLMVDELGQVGPFGFFNSSVRSMTVNDNDKLEISGIFTNYTYQDPNATSWNQNSTVPTPYAAEIAYHLTGVSDVENIKFSLYPNPSAGILNLEVESEIKDLNIYDLQGKLVFFKEALMGNQISLNLDELHGGVYLLEANLNDSKTIRKEFVLD